MSEHQRRGAVQGTDQMDGGPVLELVEAAAQRLAIESNDAHALATDMLGQQGGVQAKDVFQSLRVQPPQNGAQRRVGRRTPPVQAESVTQRHQMDVDEAVDGAIRVRPRQQAEDRKQQDVTQAVHLALGTPGIRHRGQEIEKMAERLHGNRSLDWAPKKESCPCRFANPKKHSLPSNFTTCVPPDSPQIVSDEQPCHRADLAEQELYALLLVHLALRRLMVEASRKAGCDPDTLSFIHAVRVVRRHLPFHAAFLLALPFGSPSPASAYDGGHPDRDRRGARRTQPRPA